MNILLFGAHGQAGWELQRALAPLGALTALGHAEADLEEPVRDTVLRARPAVIVNAAAYTAVDKAESEPQRALRINAGAVAEMAAAARELDALLVHYSTDYVFDGAKAGAYTVDDATAPLNVYGASKLAGEQAIRAAACRHLIFRTSWVYAARGRNFARTMLARACSLDRLQAVADTVGVPTSAALLADVTALAVHHCVTAAARALPAPDGTFHLVPAGATTWHGYAEFLVETARARGLPVRVAPGAIEAVPASAFAAPAARPRNSRLDNTGLEAAFGLQMPDWRVHVRRLVDELADAAGASPAG
jgi:dTDP-4-dehydrorhamnose reductase